jgi:hypothetical protein
MLSTSQCWAVALLTTTMLGFVGGLTGCSPSRGQQPTKMPVTTYSTISNTSLVKQRTGHGPETIVKELLDASNSSNFAFVEYPLDDQNLQAQKFNAVMDTLRPLGTNLNWVARAQVVAQARTDFAQIAGSAQNEFLKLSAQVNVVACDIALGDAVSFTKDKALLPKERDRKGTSTFALDAVSTLVGSDDVKRDHILFGTGELRCKPPLTDESIGPVRMVRPVMKITKEAVRPTFVYTDGSAQVMTFPSIEATLDTWDETAKQIHIGLQMKNLTQRVIGLKNMAIRLTHRGQMITYQTVEGEYRLLPGDTSSIALRNAAANEAENFAKTLGGASAGSSTLTVYDVPTVFDDLGNVTKKENITWSFAYTPGSDAVQELDADKSTTEWTTYRRGVDKIPK